MFGLRRNIMATLNGPLVFGYMVYDLLGYTWAMRLGQQIDRLLLRFRMPKMAK